MNKQRKTSHILNVFQYDETTGAVTLPNTLIVTAPAGNDNSTKVGTTAWVRTYVTGLSYLTGNQSITVSGDATGSGTTAITLTLANSGVTAGTYTKVTVDSKGRVTVGASATTTDIAEGTNLYYTDARVGTYLTTNTYATQSYVGTQIANLVDSSPSTLDTLNELAAALGDDPNFATTVATSIGTKQAQLNGTGFVKVTGTTVSYDNSTYALDSVVVKLTGAQTIAGIKTFQDDIKASNFLYIREQNASTLLANHTQVYTNSTYFGFTNGAGTGSAIFTYNGAFNYTLPASAGTLAITSQLHNAVTLGTANGLSLSTQVLSLGLASSSTNGALSSTDWTTFNGKQNALTNPVTGTGTSGYISKFTGSSTIGNSLIYDTGSVVLIGATTGSGDAQTKLELISSSGPIGLKIKSSGVNGNNTYLSIESSKEWRFVTNRGDLISGNQGDLIIRNNTDGINHIILNQSGTTTFRSTISNRLGIAIYGSTGTYTTGDNPYIGLGVNSADSFGSINAPYADKMKFNSYHGFEFKTSNSTESPVTMLSIGISGAATFSSIIDGTIVRLSSTQPLSFTGGGNTGTFTQSAIYSSQNNVSGNTANGIFIERGRITDSSSAEIRYLVIGSRGGQIQWQVDGSGNTTQIGSLTVATTGTFGFQDYRTQATQKVLVLNAEGVSGQYAPSLFNIYTKPGTTSNGVASIIIKSKYGSEAESGNLFEFKGDGSAIFSSSITAGTVRSINGGVDASYQDAFVGVYSSNNNEQNAIQTSVSSVAGQSGFRFQVSNGGGSSVRTTMMTLTRSNLSVSNEIIVGAQGGTDITYISGGSGYGSIIQNRYAGGSVNNELRGNGNNYFNVLLGSMGVGTNNPQYTLDVNGSGRFVGALYANNTIYGTRIHGANLVAGNIAGNMPSAPAYILIVDLNNIAGFSLSGKVNAASYTCWNISDIYIQKNYSSTAATAGIEGKFKSGCDFSIVNITYGAGNYIALRFTSNPEIDVLWTGFRLTDLLSGGAFQVITSGVTVNSTYASY